jgi:hypothetical protein
MPSPQQNVTNIPSNRVEIIDSRTGLVSREWYRFFLNIFNLAGSGGNQVSLDDLQIGPPPQPSTSSGTGTVTSVDVSGGTTGLTTSGGPVTTSGTITLAGTLAVANGGTGLTTTPANGALDIGNGTGFTRTTLTAGTGVSITNASGSITIDNTSPSSGGTVTSVAALTLGTTGTDLSSTVANSTTTPVITLNVPTASATNRGALSSADWTTFNNKGSGTVTSVTGTSPVVSSGGTTPAISLATAYGDTLNPYASKTANFFLAAPNGVAGAPTFRAVVVADIPTLNQNTTGSAATLTTGRTLAITGDLAYTSPSFDGSANVTAAGTLATVNTNVGSFTNATLTVNGKGLITAASSGTAPVTSVTATSPVASTGGATPVISMPAATTSVSGYLTSTDWTTFNNKGSGTVTAVSVASANGFAGTSSGGATPALTLSTTITGVLKGNATAISAATSGTDYSAGTSALTTGILKSTTTTGALSIAVAADFPTLNQNTTGSAATLTTPRAIYGNNFDGSAALTQIIASTYGGTGNGFTKFSGATTAEKTYSLPDATTTILTTNAAVTIAQGGTGQTTQASAFNALSPITLTGDLILGNGANSATRLAIGANGYVLTSNGTTASWAAGGGSGATITNDTATSTNVYPVFANATSGTFGTAYTSNANLLYKPSTGELTAIAQISSNGIQINANTVATSYTIATGNNGLSAGPVSVNSSITVTVSSGSTWSVV